MQNNGKRDDLLDQYQEVLERGKQPIADTGWMVIMTETQQESDLGD